MGTITLKQRKNDEPGGSGKKKWKVYFEGSDSDLKQVSDVNYILPPNFPRDKVLGRKEDNFSIDLSGYDDIKIEFEVIPADPTKPIQKLPYELKKHDKKEKDGWPVHINV